MGCESEWNDYRSLGASAGQVRSVGGPGRDPGLGPDAAGQYAIKGVQPGSYLVRVIAKGFSVDSGTSIDGGTTFDAQFDEIEAETQVVNVEAEANHVSIDQRHGGALGVWWRRIGRAVG